MMDLLDYPDDIIQTAQEMWDAGCTLGMLKREMQVFAVTAPNQLKRLGLLYGAMNEIRKLDAA